MISLSGWWYLCFYCGQGMMLCITIELNQDDSVYSSHP